MMFSIFFSAIIPFRVTRVLKPIPPAYVQRHGTPLSSHGRILFEHLGVNHLAL